MTASTSHMLADNFGALTERVTGTERQITSISDQLNAFQRDTAQQFNSLASTVQSQMAAISDKMDRQSAQFNSARSTNWTAFWASAAAVATVALGLGAAVIAPLSSSLTLAASDIREISRTTETKDDFRQYQMEMNGWAASLRDRLRADEDASVSQRQVGELAARLDDRDKIRSDNYQQALGLLQKRVDDLEHSSSTHAELESSIRRTDERFAALNGYLGDLRKDYADALQRALGLKIDGAMR